MKCLSIKGAQNTPKVRLCAKKGLIEISGRSAPRNSYEFYQPIVDWLEEYSKAPKPKTSVNINFNFFDTGSSRCFIDVLLILQNVHNINQGVEIKWYYDIDDDEMLESGYDFESITRIPFKMIEVHHVNQ